MNKKYTFISLFILTSLYSQQSFADLKTQCLLGVPQFSGDVVGNPNDLPIYIESERAMINQPSQAIYSGNVDIKQGNRHLKTEQAEVKQINNEPVAYLREGFNYKDEQINLVGANAEFNLNKHNGNISDANYQLVNRQGRGQAEQFELENNYRLMKNATFTSCLPDDNSWSIEAAEIKQYIQQEYAEMWHARFKVAGVPVFYTPYLQLPIGDRRRSGLLMPNGGISSRDGYWYAQPIYWNIAPNYDATITPKYMSHRGWQLNGEFRYLTAIGEGELATEYLGDDHYDEYSDDNRKRYLFYWKHSSSFLQNWRFNVDYTRVSDKHYFTNFDSNYGSSTDGYANQYAQIAYYQPHYNLALSVQQFQIFDEVEIGPYRTLPQVDFNYYKNNLLNGWLDFKLYSQGVYFDNKSNLMPTAWRFHLEPSLSTAMANQYGSLEIETKLYATHYYQKKGSNQKAEPIQTTVNRVLPQIKVDLKTTLATMQTPFNGYTQTLEPRIQYLYRAYQDQSNIGSQYSSEYLGYGYDSALVQQDYYSLFQDRRFSGLDRIASANQITLGGTSRFYDEMLNERFNLSAGQIYYLTASKIDDNIANNVPRSSSSWAIESNWKINQKWNWHGSYQYDTRTDRTSLANSSLEFNPEKNNLIQLNYRYVSRDYIDQNLGNTSNAYGQDIKQLGLVGAWEISDNWVMAAHYYQDLALRKPVEQYIGVQYNSCCWAIGIGARRYVTSKSYQKQNEVLYDNSISFTFELRGLGTNDHKSGIDKMLNQGKLPYIRAFSL